MLVVSNTSPISGLATIGRLSLLKAQFGEIRIPDGVAAELGQMPDRRALEAIQHGLGEGWIKVQAVGNRNMVRLGLSNPKSRRCARTLGFSWRRRWRAGFWRWLASVRAEGALR